MALEQDENWMRYVLALARRAAQLGEVPVGAAVVLEGKLLGEGFNGPISSGDPTAHAEMIAIRSAARNLGNYRLTGSTLYSTLEPCVMCAGALVHARVGRLVFGARDLRFGGVRSKFELVDSDILNHKMDVVEGIAGAECSELLTLFFRERR